MKTCVQIHRFVIFESGHNRRAGHFGSGGATLTDINGEEKDRETITLNRVTEPNPSYVLKDEFEEAGADNWFVEKSDGTIGFFQFPKGYFSINDTIEDIMSTELGTKLMMYIISQTAVQGNQMELLDYLKGYTVKALMKLASGKNGTPETLLMLNEMLNKVAKAN